jgi:hypothetical protein
MPLENVIWMDDDLGWNLICDKYGWEEEGERETEKQVSRFE